MTDLEYTERLIMKRIDYWTSCAEKAFINNDTVSREAAINKAENLRQVIELLRSERFE